MIEWTLLDAAIVAGDAHEGQVDKQGRSAILHPLRVMARMTTEDERILALLHDVIEDNDEYGLNGFACSGLKPEILAGLDAITRRKDEAYTDYIRRVSGNALATRVKIQDLKDNLVRCHLKPEFAGLEKKYRTALLTLEGVFPYAQATAR